MRFWIFNIFSTFITHFAIAQIDLNDTIGQDEGGILYYKYEIKSEETALNENIKDTIIKFQFKVFKGSDFYQEHFVDWKNEFGSLEFIELTHTVEFKKGIKTHSFNYYTESDRKCCESKFLNGKLNGEQVCYYPNGNIQSRSEYIKGVSNGVSYIYYPNGIIKNVSFRDSSLDTENTYSYYDNGQPWEYIYTRCSNMDFDCERKIVSYYENGNIGAIYTLGAGIKPFIVFYDDGAKMIEGYVDRRYNNFVKTLDVYYDNNRLAIRMNFNNDSSLEGELLLYNKEGKLCIRKKFKNGIEISSAKKKSYNSEDIELLINKTKLFFLNPILGQ